MASALIRERQRKMEHVGEGPGRHGGRVQSGAALGQGTPVANRSWKTQGPVLPQSHQRQHCPLLLTLNLSSGHLEL